jgi:MoaA/NifB/PqqE/SkfB family radical SAM enzyme
VIAVAVDKVKRDFTLQYHITVKCDYNCSHCYLQEDSYKSELDNVQDITTVKKVIDNYVEFLNRFSDELGIILHPVIHFTGGDPLLRPDFFKIVDYAVSKGVKIGILGNPDRLTTDVCRRIVNSGVRSYQISLDGPKEMHDTLRKKEGSFEKSLEAIQMLKEAGIKKTFSMYNVSVENIQYLLDTYKILNNIGTYGFVFARVVCMGNASNMNTNISPLEYKSYLKEMDDYVGGVENRREGFNTRVILKEPLWSLYNYEKGTLKNIDLIDGGCHVGINMLCMLADGTVYACRRMETPLGHVPSDDLYDIFTENELLNKFRDFNNYEKCKSCEII